tara:strand:+ start:108 stop:347 length:240 start_codon:yes stop_codon:yes gene_type:complete
MLLSEIRHYKEKDGSSNTDYEMSIRCEACATVTSKLLARIFREEDAEEIQELINESHRSEKKELLDNISELIGQMKYPN